MKVSVLMKRTNRPHHLMFPVRVFRRQIADHGVTVAIHHMVDAPGLFDADVFVVVEGDVRHLLPEADQHPDGEIALLQRARAAGCTVAWFDDSDSSGQLRSYVFPHVDRYFKSQVLVDVERYHEPSISGVVFRDHFIRRHGITDTSHAWKGPVAPHELTKLALGWNWGMGDWPLQGVDRARRWLRLRNPRPNYRWTLAHATRTPLAGRPVDVTYRVGFHPRAPAVQHHRMAVDAILAELAEQGVTVGRGAPLPRGKYQTELRSSVVAPSPFGYGELCYRDFEAFTAGCVLLKPDMSHLRTWPDYFRPDETMVVHDWDLEELADRVLDITHHRDRYTDIAREGQRRFLHHLTDDGAAEFAARFAAVVRDARDATAARGVPRQPVR
jgi:hypothetical protein